MQAIAPAGLHRCRGAGAVRPMPRVAQASAALETARINLRYASVDGADQRADRAFAGRPQGALASASQPTPLAVIQRLDPIYRRHAAVERRADRPAPVAGSAAKSARAAPACGSSSRTAAITRYAGVVRVLRHLGRREHRHRHLARELPQSAGPAAAGHVRDARCSTRQSSRERFSSRSLRCSAISTARPSSTWSARDNKAVRRKVTALRTNGTNWVVTAGLQRGRPGDHPGPRQQRPARTARSRPVPASAPQKIAAARARRRRRQSRRAGKPACPGSSSTGRSSPGCSRSS